MHSRRQGPDHVRYLPQHGFGRRLGVVGRCEISGEVGVTGLSHSDELFRLRSDTLVGQVSTPGAGLQTRSSFSCAARLPAKEFVAGGRVPYIVVPYPGTGICICQDMVLDGRAEAAFDLRESTVDLGRLRGSSTVVRFKECHDTFGYSLVSIALSEIEGGVT